jgi:hypothetical protein
MYEPGEVQANRTLVLLCYQGGDWKAHGKALGDVRRVSLSFTPQSEGVLRIEKVIRKGWTLGITTAILAEESAQAAETYNRPDFDFVVIYRDAQHNNLVIEKLINARPIRSGTACDGDEVIEFMEFAGTHRDEGVRPYDGSYAIANICKIPSP